MSDEELDERKAKVLKAVVEGYIDTAQPVGSGHVARTPGVDVSSATVRNDFAALEAEGYLAQPHTSAGRVPTEKGYRFFVDHIGGSTRLAGADAQQIRSFFAQAHGEIEQTLRDTSQLLARLTRYAAVVVGPPHEAALVRSVQLVGLTPRVALLVIVLSNGAIDKHTLELDGDTDEPALAAAARQLAKLAVNRSLADVAAMTSDGSAPPDAVVEMALRAMSGSVAEGDEVYTTGTSDLVSSFDAVAQVSEVLRILEQQFVVVTLLRDVIDRGLNVAIGTETGIEPLADCAVVVAPYEVDGEPAGSIGVLGPTRMHYPQALATVAVVSQRLGDRLSEPS